jgi:hypothetical protein
MLSELQAPGPQHQQQHELAPSYPPPAGKQGIAMSLRYTPQPTHQQQQQGAAAASCATPHHQLQQQQQQQQQQQGQTPYTDSIPGFAGFMVSSPMAMTPSPLQASAAALGSQPETEGRAAGAGAGAGLGPRSVARAPGSARALDKRAVAARSRAKQSNR